MSGTQAIPGAEPAYRWVIVAAGGLIGCMAMGAIFSLPVFLAPITQATGWSRTGVSFAMTVAFLALAVSALGWGMLVDRIGPRPVLLIGEALLAVGLVVASQAPNLLTFQIAFGGLTGVAGSAILPPLVATVTGWFETRRGLAVSLVSAGFGMAPLTMSPLAAALVARIDWREAMLAIAAIAFAVMVPTTLLVRRPPAEAAGATASTAPTEGNVVAALKSPAFLILAATSFLCCATHSGPIFHTISYAIVCGVPPMAAVSIYSLEGLAGMGGRLGFGLLSDRFGVKPTLVAGLLVQAAIALCYAFVRELDGFYVVAALFGFTYSGLMPLFSVLARENFSPRIMGTVVGGLSTASSFGMALGPLAGGWIYDTFATYSWLFVGSFGAGIGATLVALTFRPFRQSEPPLAIPAA
jgi:MFS family permease